jgi:hypothetical protein
MEDTPDLGSEHLTMVLVKTAAEPEE